MLAGLVKTWQGSEVLVFHYTHETNETHETQDPKDPRDPRDPRDHSNPSPALLTHNNLPKFWLQMIKIYVCLLACKGFEGHILHMTLEETGMFFFSISWVLKP